MPLLLSIDSSEFKIYAALSFQGRVVSAIEENCDFVAERIPAAILQLLEDNGMVLSQVAGALIALGPGSYTGIRSGIATARGLTQGLGIPLYGVPSLLGRLYPLVTGAGNYIASLPARTGERFLAGYSFNPPRDRAANYVYDVSPTIPCSIVQDSEIDSYAAQGHVCRLEELSVNPAGSLLSAAIEWSGVYSTTTEPIYGKPVQAKTIMERRAHRINQQ